MFVQDLGLERNLKEGCHWHFGSKIVFRSNLRSFPFSKFPVGDARCICNQMKREYECQCRQYQRYSLCKAVSHTVQKHTGCLATEWSPGCQGTGNVLHVIK